MLIQSMTEGPRYMLKLDKTRCADHDNIFTQRARTCNAETTWRFIDVDATLY